MGVLLLLAGCSEPRERTPEQETEPAPEIDATPPCRGLIVDEGIRPLHGVHVQIVEADWFAVTDASGTFSWEGAPDGNWAVVYGAGNRTGSVQVEIQDGCPASGPMEKMRLVIGPRSH